MTTPVRRKKQVQAIRRRSADVRITARDVEIFTFLYQNKVASFKQIERRFFGNVKTVAAYKCLRRLIWHGYLERLVRIQDKRAVNAYCLTERSFERFINSQDGVKFRAQYRSNSIEHDIQLIEIQQRIRECSNFVSYFPENVLQSGSDVISSLPLEHFVDLRTDAVFELRLHNTSYYLGLEFEATLKFSKRYVDRFMSYHLNSQVGTLLFVCADESIKKSLMQIEKMSCASFQPKIYYSTLEKVLDRNCKLQFSNIKGDILLIE